MKGILIYIMSIGILIIGFIVFFEMMKPTEKQGDNVRKLPEMYITIGDETYKAAKGSYCWRWITRGECADSSGNPFDYKRNSKPILITSDTPIVISFSKKPNHVSTLMLNRDYKETSLKGFSFPPPTEKGIYGFSVYATWNEGDITFMFLIEVQ